MFELSVELRDDGTVEISQPNGLEEPAVVLIAPEQVGVVVEWLQEAAAKVVANGFLSVAAGVLKPTERPGK
jgi:hypothetical protein